MYMFVIKFAKLYLARSKIRGAGRGVFAGEYTMKDRVIEQSPVIDMPGSDLACVQKTKLAAYYYRWGESSQDIGIALGYGSLYNHSSYPNITFIKNIPKQLIEYTKARVIRKDQELNIDYNYGVPFVSDEPWVKETKI
jgi:SET domain-containing protein